MEGFPPDHKVRAFLGSLVGGVGTTLFNRGIVIEWSGRGGLIRNLVRGKREENRAATTHFQRKGEGMRLIVLGSGGYHPSERRHTLCHVIPEAGVILDAGTGFFRVGRFLDEQPWHIFLTHAHLDHIIGLTYYWSVSRDRSLGPITVWGSDKTIEAVKRHLFSEPLFPKMPPYEFALILPGEKVTVPSERESGEFTVTSFPLSHPGGAQGYRFDFQDRSLAYVTDTTAAARPTYVQKIMGVDVLIHEAYFPPGYEDLALQTGHVSSVQAAEVARECQAKRLLLVHVNPLSEDSDPLRIMEVRAVFPNVTVAEDGMSLAF